MKQNYFRVFLGFCSFVPLVVTAQSTPNTVGGPTPSGVTAAATAQSTPYTVGGQTLNVPTSAVPFLNFTPDARSGALGDAGVALSDPDANAVFWNPSKLTFAKQDKGASLSYTPWLRNLIGDMYYSYLSGYSKVGKNSVVSGALTYFDLGTVDFTNATGATLGTFNSREYAITASYAQRLSQNFSLAVSLKYLNSNLASGGSSVGLKPGSTAAADISAYYYNESRDNATGKGIGWSFGGIVSNLGGRLNYGGTERYFIPTNLRLGTGLTIFADQYNKFNFVLDANKLMVPTPNIVNGVNLNANKNYFSSIFGSFADAPGGFSEELKEVTLSVGAEYWYNNQFAARVGYYNESKDKGGRKYATAGIGLRLQQRFGVDFSYLIPVVQGSPLADTFRISLILNFNKGSRIADDEAVTDDTN